MPPRPLTPATFHILLTLARGAVHGYGIKHAVEERTIGAVQLGPGTLYAALARLVDEGLVRQIPPRRTSRPTAGPPSPTYALTAAGRAALRMELARLEGDVRLARAVLARSQTRRGAASRRP
jgi:DNA-binding PadR family transcriptional regulator